MKTLSELKRESQNGSLELQLQPVGIWNGGLPERLQGWRKVIGSNSVAILLQTADGRTSHLEIKKASLCEYDGETLTVYLPGYREPTADEQKVLDDWKAITDQEDYKQRAEYDALTDGSSTYWQEKHFFESRGYGYLRGFDEERGLRKDLTTGLIRDCKIKGQIELQYKVRRAA